MPKVVAVDLSECAVVEVTFASAPVAETACFFKPEIGRAVLHASDVGLVYVVLSCGVSRVESVLVIHVAAKVKPLSIVVGAIPICGGTTSSCFDAHFTISEAKTVRIWSVNVL